MEEYVMDETSSDEDATGVILSFEHSDDGDTDHVETEGDDDGDEAQNNVSMVHDGHQEFDISEVYDVNTVNSIRTSTPDPPVVENADGPSRMDSEIKCSSQGRSRADTSQDDDGQTCTICFEPWTNSSEHRLISLRCGHLFGRSCITRWLKGQNSRCPQCNARARKSEIRNIYAKTVKVMDSTERDKALQDLQKESEKRRKAEMQTAHERLKLLMKTQECENLKKELMESNKLLQEYRCNSKSIEKSHTAKKGPAFSLEKNIEISKNGGCRIIAVSDLLGMILVSQQSTNGLFPGYGFRKISTAEMKPSEFVLVHQKIIKDIAFHCHDGLVLTASLDKTVRLTNVLTNSVVQMYSMDSDVWSCAWDADNPVYFYAGAKSSDVYLYDIRVTNRYVQELPKFGSRTPVVAVQYIRKSSYPSLRNCGPVVGKLSDCGFFQKSSQEGEYNAVRLPTAGPLASLSSEPMSGHILMSCRPSQCQPRLSHTLCELVSDPSGQGVSCNPVIAVWGGRSQVQLTRSKLLPHPDDSSSLLICAGDEDAHGALIWDGSSGKSLDHLKTDSPVLDFADLKMNHKSVLMALTDRNLRLYSWNNQS